MDRLRSGQAINVMSVDNATQGTIIRPNIRPSRFGSYQYNTNADGVVVGQPIGQPTSPTYSPGGRISNQPIIIAAERSDGSTRAVVIQMQER